MTERKAGGPKVIAIANHKGGTGKSSTAINLSCALAVTRRKILLVDLDPQGSATVALGYERDSSPSLAAPLLEGSPIADCIVRYEAGRFDFIPSGDELTAVTVALYQEIAKERRLRASLSKVVGNYDYVIIDCPPAGGLLTINALCASDYLLIPMPCEFFALDALNSLVAQFTELNSRGLANVSLLGVVRTFYEEQRELTAAISAELEQGFGPLLFDTIIPFNARISEASSLGKPVMLYDRSSQGARSYLVLAGELLQKMREREPDPEGD
ncbi:MAG: ParA family protein [Succinivibrionaceae bacterium]|nr:ParA family protein [Succinivibrionaceae bacterium]